MDRITEYRQIVQEFLIDFATISPTYQLIFDTTRDRYSAIVGSIDYHTIEIVANVAKPAYAG